MALLSDRDRNLVVEEFAGLTGQVTILFFTQAVGCESCGLAGQILGEVASLSDRLTLEEVNFVLDADKRSAYRIDRVPAIALVGERDTGIRFYGAPSGYEFMSLIDAIKRTSAGDSGLSDESRALVATVKTPMHIQVFVTPT